MWSFVAVAFAPQTLLFDFKAEDATICIDALFLPSLKLTFILLARVFAMRWQSEYRKQLLVRDAMHHFITLCNSKFTMRLQTRGKVAFISFCIAFQCCFVSAFLLSVLMEASPCFANKSNLMIMWCVCVRPRGVIYELLGRKIIVN